MTIPKILEFISVIIMLDHAHQEVASNSLALLHTSPTAGGPCRRQNPVVQELRHEPWRQGPDCNLDFRLRVCCTKV